MNTLCPYCLNPSRPLDSGDHIFPKFLGGTLVVPSCSKCNNTFGTDFEGPVSKDLAPLIVFLSFCGYKHKRIVTHQRALVEESTGIEFDVDSERRAYPSKPHIILENGKIKQFIVRSPKEARKQLESLKAKGLAKDAVATYRTWEGRPPLSNARVPIGMEIRQLAVKMCVATGQRVIPDITLVDDVCREFLLAAKPLSSPVRLAITSYPELDARRGPLAHVVYIEGDPVNARCFGVVQFFGGAIQLYVPLCSSYRGRTFGCLGVLDINTFEQQFDEIDPLRLPEAPIEGLLDDWARCWAGLGSRLNTQVQECYGDNVILFGAAPKQLVKGVQLTLPLVWVEHQLEIQVDLQLVPDRQYEVDVSIPRNPSEWVFSTDYGSTSMPLFDAFIQQWNCGLLNRDLYRYHLYDTDDMAPGTRLLLGGDCWCPVLSISITYLVNKQAWLTSAKVSSLPMEIDLVNHRMLTRPTITQDDLPTVRDPSWPVLPDPGGFAATAENVIVLERWEIDRDSFRFKSCGFGSNGQ
jgi:HNH endonuclease